MTTAASTQTTSWVFRTRFRRAACGWKSTQLAIDRIHEALAEIRAVARHDPASAAEGAVLLLEKLSPALCQIDSSSGALGNATYATVQELAPLISQAPVSTTVRSKWLDRLFEAIQEDDPPYIESLGDHWGDLCATKELASAWADQLLPTLKHVLRDRKSGTYAHFSGTSLCYGALFKAERHDEILELLAIDPHPIWSYLVWGAKVMAARGQIDEAIAYLRERAGSTTSETTIARFAEAELLEVGRRAEAFNQYALLANQANAHLSTFRALTKKYPELAKDRLLDHLVGSTPAEPGKWFATAKTLKLFEQATRLAWASPCDPKTLNRAARDHLKTQPAFALQCALASLHWMSLGHGYELTGLDVQDAHRMALEAAAAQQTKQAQATIQHLLAPDRPMAAWMKRSLGRVSQPAAPAWLLRLPDMHTANRKSSTTRVAIRSRLASMAAGDHSISEMCAVTEPTGPQFVRPGCMPPRNARGKIRKCRRQPARRLTRPSAPETDTCEARWWPAPLRWRASPKPPSRSADAPDAVWMARSIGSLGRPLTGSSGRSSTQSNRPSG